MISNVIKQSTRITGLAVSTNPHHSLSVLYGKILKAIEGMPDSSAYKRHTKSLVDERLKLVNTIKDPVELEKQINSGQIEEVIKEAESEVVLARQMAEWKPWEKLVGQAPPTQWKWPL